VPRRFFRKAIFFALGNTPYQLSVEISLEQLRMRLNKSKLNLPVHCAHARVCASSVARSRRQVQALQLLRSRANQSKPEQTKVNLALPVNRSIALSQVGCVSYKLLRSLEQFSLAWPVVSSIIFYMVFNCVLLLGNARQQ
jgi:hypothetical protein